MAGGRAASPEAASARVLSPGIPLRPPTLRPPSRASPMPRTARVTLTQPAPARPAGEAMPAGEWKAHRTGRASSEAAE